jgi:hypothetical protein
MSFDSLLAKSPCIIYQPGGVVGGLVVTAWQQVQEFIALREGAVIVYVDDSIVSPALVPGASGITDCEGRVEIRPFLIDSTNYSTLQVEDGATLQNLYSITDVEVRCNSQSATPSLSFSGTPTGGVLILQQFGLLSQAATATQPGVSVPAGTRMLISLSGDSAIVKEGFNDFTVPLFDVPATANLTLLLLDASFVENNYAAGAGTVNFDFDNSSAFEFFPIGTPPTLPGLTGTYTKEDASVLLGDVTGADLTSLVVAWRNHPLDPATMGAPAVGNVPHFDGTSWVAGTVPSGSVSGTPNTVAYFNGAGVLTETPAFLTAIDTTGFFLVGATATDNGSAARVQNSSIIANASQFRSNQYGNSNAAPGLSTFKSRGATIGTLAGLQAGDPISRWTTVGVAPDNASIPLSSFVTVQVPTNFVPAGQNWLPSELEVQLVPLAGPINSRRPVFKITSEGETETLRGVRAGGPATLPTNLTTGALWSSGAGNPNGAVTGSPGDLWSDQTDGLGATLWVKETGVATNTGWVVPGAETRIDFTASTTDIFAPASVGIRRVRWQGCGGGGGGSGGGGGAISGGNAGGEGGGGGGGSTLQTFETDIDLSHRIDVVIGAGGTPGAGGTADTGTGAGSGGSGGDGGSTYVFDFTTNTVLATFSGASGGAGGSGGSGGGPIVLTTAGGCTFSGAQTVNPNNGFPAAGGPGGPGGSLGPPGGGSPGNTNLFATGTALPGTGLFSGGAGGTTGGTIEGGGGGGGGAGPYGAGAVGGDGVDGPGTAGGDATANSGAGAGGGGGGESGVSAAGTQPGGPGGTGGSGRLTGFYFT